MFKIFKGPLNLTLIITLAFQVWLLALSTPLIPTVQAAGIIKANTAYSGVESISHHVTLDNITAGNMIVVGISQRQSANITYTVTDSQSNNYSTAVSTGQSSTRKSQIFFATNVAGTSSLTVTVTASS